MLSAEYQPVCSGCYYLSGYICPYQIWKTFSGDMKNDPDMRYISRNMHAVYADV